ncbi:hypothetical protein V6N13_124419 [Hibiscus sabdariffa]
MSPLLMMYATLAFLLLIYYVEDTTGSSISPIMVDFSALGHVQYARIDFLFSPSYVLCTLCPSHESKVRFPGLMAPFRFILVLFSIFQSAWIELFSIFTMFIPWKDQAMIKFSLRIAPTFFEILGLLEDYVPLVFADDPVGDHPQHK